MGAYSSLQQLSQPVDMTGWADPYASGDIPQPIAPIRPLSPLGTSTTAAAPTAATTDPNASGIAAARGIDTSNPSLYSPTGGSSIFTQATTWIKANTENFVFIIAGLILIAAALFSFKGTQTIITTATSAGKKAAEVAA